MSKNKKEMTGSHFNMWRLVVSAVHADNKADEAELKMIEPYLSELHFNEEQLNLLQKELKRQASVDEILPAITDPGDRSQSVYFVRLLFWKDQRLTSSEEVFLNKVQDYFAQFLNMDELEAKLSQVREAYKNRQNNLDMLPDTPIINLWRSLSGFFKKAS